MVGLSSTHSAATTGTLAGSGGRRLLSFVVPVFNEEENVLLAYEAIVQAVEPLASRFDFEFIFTDNHSTDRTPELLEMLAARDPRVRVLRFSRNFGFQRSILTGYLAARGDAAIQLDCDLQDPPALAVEFVRRWEEGYQVVYGVRRSRKEAWWLTRARALFYRLINALSEDELPLDSGDFRLVDRRVLDELRRFDDSQPYLRGTIASMGFNQVGVPYDRPERLHGSTKFSWGALVRLALDGILNHSTVPLRLASYTGLTVSVVTFGLLLYYLVRRLLFGADWPPGFATLTVLILMSLSLNAMFLGIIGEYLGRIYQQVKKRPLTIVERELNAPDAEPRPGQAPTVASRPHTHLGPF